MFANNVLGLLELYKANDNNCLWRIGKHSAKTSKKLSYYI